MKFFLTSLFSVIVNFFFLTFITAVTTLYVTFLLLVLKMKSSRKWFLILVSFLTQYVIQRYDP